MDNETWQNINTYKWDPEESRLTFFKSVSQTIIHISTTNLWFGTILQKSIKKYVVSINSMKSNECKLFQQNVKK